MPAFALAIAIVALQEPLVSFEHRAARVELLFPELSKAAGVNLTFSAQTKDEVLIFSVKDVPLSELRSKIAEATSAEWQTEPDGFRLIRSAKRLEALERKHIELVAASVRKSQERIAAQLQEVGDFSDAYARAMAERLQNYLDEQVGSPNRTEIQRLKTESLRNGLPGWRLTARLVAKLDPEMLASIPAEDALVLSTQPNALQKPFPPSIAEDLKTYALEAAKLAAALPGEQKMPTRGVESNIWNAVNLYKTRDPLPAKVILRLSSPQRYGSSYLQLLVADAKGKVFDRAYLNLSPTAPGMGSPPPAPPAPDPNEQPIPLSDLSKAYLAAFDRTNTPGGGAKPGISDALREFLLNPETHEISSLALSDMVLGTARQLSRNVAVSPTNGLPFYGSGREQKPSQFLASLRSWSTNGLAVTDDGSWLVAKPADWVANREVTPDCRAAGRFHRDAVKRKFTLDDLAALALAMPSESAYSTVCQGLRPIIGAGYDMFSFSGGPFGLLQIHGSLGPSQVQAALQGRPIAYGNLTPWQQKRLQRLVIAKEQFLLEYDYSRAPPTRGEDTFELFGSLRSEPTECYPAGIPGSALLTISDRSQMRIRCMQMENNQIRGMAEMSVESLASMLMAKERPEAFGPAPEFEYSQFSALSKTLVAYELRAFPLLYHHGEISLTNSVSERVSSIDRLPSDVKAKIDAEMAKLREGLKGYKPPPR